MKLLVRIAGAPLTLLSWALVFPLPGFAQTTDQPRVEANVVFGMYSGLALLMDVHYPQEPNGYGIICIPGSGWHAPLGYGATPLKNSPGHMGAPKRLVDAGYTVFVINHRAAPLFHYPAAVEDSQRAVRFVRHEAKKFGINPDRIGGTGYSSGGHLVSLLGVLDGKGANEDRDPVDRESAKLQAVVAGGYPSDLTVSLTPFGQPFVASFMGMVIVPWLPQPSTESKKYKEASPIVYISADDAPHLLFHGDADEVVPFKHAQLMEEAMHKAGVPVKLLRIPGGTHGNLRTKNAPDYLDEMVRWFDRYLRNLK